MLIDNFLDDRQPQTGPPGLRRDIRFENARHYLRREAGSAIIYCHFDHAVVLAGKYADFLMRQVFLCIFGVSQQVVDNLPELRRITKHRRQVAAQRQSDARRRRLVQTEDFADQRVEIERLALRCRQAGIVGKTR